jgi:hypothetical protein
MQQHATHRVTFHLCIFVVRVLHPATALALIAAAKRKAAAAKKKSVAVAKKLMQKLLLQEQNEDGVVAVQSDANIYIFTVSYGHRGLGICTVAQ